MAPWHSTSSSRASQAAAPSYVDPPQPFTSLSSAASSSSSSAPLRIKITKRSRASEASGDVQGQTISLATSSSSCSPCSQSLDAQEGSSRLSGTEAAATPTTHSAVAAPNSQSLASQYISSETLVSSNWPSPSNHPLSAPKRKRRQHLKDVLLKLVQGLIKRDAYGFFLHAVDEKEVPGYRTVIREPMDLGTMERKVHDSAYPTMDSFRSDFLLLTKNAKLFNPPDSIYHIQAQKLEDHGIKAMEKLEEKGFRQEGDESSLEMDSLDIASPALDARPSTPDAGQTNMSPLIPKRISIKIKKRPSVGPHLGSQGTKRPRKSTSENRIGSQDGGLEASNRAPSRPLISSSLSQPPVLATSPSAASDEIQVEDSEDSEDDTASVANRKIKVEDTEEESEDGAGGDFDSDHDDGQESTHEGSSRAMSTSCASLTPAPGGHASAAALAAANRRKGVPPRGRHFPPRNAPPTKEEALSTAINRMEAASKDETGLEIGLNEAALRVRSEARSKDPTRPITYLPDGSIDLDSLRFAERCDLLASLGFTLDSVTGHVPLSLSDSVAMPEITSSHPLHPDAQRFSGPLTRPAPYDALSLATNEAPVPREASGSHYEHAMPPHHHRLPMYLPTMNTENSAVPIPEAYRRLGSVATSVATTPHRWPHPKRPQLSDYEVPTQIDPLYPRSTDATKPAVQGKDATSAPGAAAVGKSKNKDMELFLMGQSHLKDWTYPHIYYSRAWDGATDLAIWKDVEGAIIGGGPGTGPSGQGIHGPPPGGGFCLYGPDGNLGPYERWEWSRLELLRNSIMWEDNEATFRAAGVIGPDRISERAMLEMLNDVDSVNAKETKCLGGGLRSSAIPAHEKASQAESSARFLQNNIWGGFEGEMWASSVERFVRGALDSVASRETSECSKAETQDHHESLVTEIHGEHESQRRFAGSPQQELKSHKWSAPDCMLPCKSTSTEVSRLFEASLRDMVLDRSLYAWIRDEVIVPASKCGFAAVISRTGELVEGFEKAAQPASRQENDTDSAPSSTRPLDADISDLDDKQLLGQIQQILSSHPTAPSDLHKDPQSLLTEGNVSYLMSHMPLIWSRLRLVRSLLDRPLRLVEGDDLPPFFIDPSSEERKCAEWYESPPRPSQAQWAKIRDHRLHPVRFDDREWTGTKLAQALRQYAHIELELDRQIRQQRSFKDAVGIGEQGASKQEEFQGSPEAGKAAPERKSHAVSAERSKAVGEEEEEFQELKEEMRLALLALARFAPNTSILL